MTPTRLRECLNLVGWSQRGLADKLGVDERQARRWATGSAPIPEAVAKWLEQIATLHAANPAPTGRVRKPAELSNDDLTFLQRVHMGNSMFTLAELEPFKERGLIADGLGGPVLSATAKHALETLLAAMDHRRKGTR